MPRPGQAKTSELPKKNTSINKQMRALKDKAIYDFTKEYTCTMCGAVYKEEDEFLSARNNIVFQENGKVPFCRKCCNALQEEYMRRYKDERLVFMLMCHHLGYYYDEVIYESIKDNKNFSFNKFVTTVAVAKGKRKSFVDTIVEIMKNRLKDTEEVREVAEDKWTDEDKNMKEQCTEWVGYDPFDDETYSSKDRKWLFSYLYNNLSDDILEDSKKVNAMVELSKTQLQIFSMNETLNRELKAQAMDYMKVEKLVNIKNKLSSTYNDIANENGLSQKGSGVKVRRSNALSSIMKEMIDNNFEEIKTNYIDSKMSQSYKEIAEFNAKALQNELLLSADDYALMVARQTEKITDMQNKLDSITEENRKLKIKLKELKEKK